MYLVGVLVTLLPLEIFARAGGGGSSSGGDGGSGIIVLVGYVPMHFLGALLRRGKSNEGLWVILQVIGWIVAVAYMIVLMYLGFLGVLMAIGAFLGMGAGLYGWFGKLKRNKRVETAIKLAAQNDPAWDEQEIVTRTKEVFARYQADWSARQMDRLAEYMTPVYARHSQLMIAALLQGRRTNQVENPTVTDCVVVDMLNPEGTDSDIVTVGVQASATDKLIDDRTGKVLNTDKSPFTEFWRFRRSGNTWLLDGIQQATASYWVSNPTLESFASQYGYFYSLDWGSLLIPTRGQIFKGARFNTADINNHIIGLYGNSFLLQIYTYSAQPRSNSGRTYLVAQTNVLREYGEILVRRKHGLFQLPPRGLRKISMEWGDFNKKYEVYASSAEGATSFELLDPTFMVKLEALPFAINIEVVDNIVYLYAHEDKAVKPEHYPLMLQVLQDAYKQMKL